MSSRTSTVAVVTSETTVEQYLQSKNVAYGKPGRELHLDSCPGCRKDKFFIGENWLFHCKHPSCPLQRGNGSPLLVYFADTYLNTSYRALRDYSARRQATPQDVR